MVKREVRMAYMDTVPGMARALVIIFRGGWIDAIVSCEASKAEELIEWFRSSGYLEEIKAFAIGEGLHSLEGVSELEDWLVDHGVQRGGLPARNAMQVSVIMEGLREYHRCKSRG